MTPSCKWPVKIKIDKAERVHVIKGQNRKRKGEKKCKNKQEKKKRKKRKTTHKHQVN